MLSGAVADVGDAYGSFVATAPAAVAATVIFRGITPWDQLGTAHDVPVAETAEPSPLGVAEYLFYFAAFFDKEAEAAAAFAAIAARYACAAAAAPPAAASAPRVLWASRFESVGAAPWYVGSCAGAGAWYCPLVAAAGGALVARADGATNLDDAAFAALAATATHFVYTGNDWDAVLGPAAAGGTGALGALLAAVPAVKAKAVFAVDAAGVNAWFDSRPAAPDAVLQDLLLALAPAAAAAAGLKTPVFIRNVFGGVPAGGLSPLAACSNGNTTTLTRGTATGACAAAAAPAAGVNVPAAIGGAVGGALVLIGVVAAAVAAHASAAAAAAAAAKVAALTATAPAAAAPAAAGAAV